MPAALRLARRINSQELRARPGRILMFVVSIAVGVALGSAMRLATDSAVDKLNAELELVGGRSDLQITFGTGEIGFAERTVDKVRELPEVANAAAVVRGLLTFADDSGDSLELFGIDLLQADILDLYQVEILQRTPDDFSIINDPHGIFLINSVAEKRNLDLESTVDLVGVDGRQTYTVRGILDAGDLAEAYGNEVAIMYLPAAQPVAGRIGNLDESHIDRIDVVLGQGIGIEEAKIALASVLPAELNIAEPAHRRLANRRTVDGLRLTLLGISNLALIVATFIVYASTTGLVRTRISTLATLLMLGITRSTLMASLLVEVALLGLIGSLLGVAAGVLASSYIVGDVTAGMGLNYGLRFGGGSSPPNLWATVGLYGFLGTAASICSAYLPVRALAEFDPLAAKKSPLSTDRPDWPAARFRFVGFTAIAAGLLAIGYGYRHNAAAAGSLGGVTVPAGLVLLAIPSIPTLWAQLKLRLRDRFALSGGIALENLSRNANRSAVTIGAVALCICVAITAGTIVTSFRGSLTDWYGFRGTATVSARATHGGWLSAPVPVDIETTLRSLPAVRNVETLRVVNGQKFRDDRIAVVGLSSGFIHHAHLRAVRNTNSVSSIVEGRAIAVSSNFASRFEASLGDALSLNTPTGNLSLPIAAIIPDYTSDKGSVILSRDVVRQRWSDTSVNYFSIDLHDGFETAQLRTQLSSHYPDLQHLSVMNTSALRNHIDAAIDLAFADIDGIQLLVLFITLIGVYEFLASTVRDRWREISLLRMIAFTRKDIGRVFLIESSAVGLAASALGVMTGAITSWIWIAYNYPVLVGYVLDFSFAWATVGQCVVLATLTAALAGWTSASIAARKPVTELARMD